MPDQISEEIKEEHYHRLMAIQAKISEERNQRFEGQTLKILIEGKHPEQEDLWYGRSYWEALDVDGQVFVETDQDLKIGTLVKARIDQGFAYDLVVILDKS